MAGRPAMTGGRSEHTAAGIGDPRDDIGYALPNDSPFTRYASRSRVCDSASTIT
jgi:hypothetical protein